MPKISDEQREARHRQILEAAMACFSRKGIQPTTMADICSEAGLSRGAVYVYFKSKRDIIQGVCELSSETNRSLLTRAAPGSDTLQALHSMARAGAAVLSGPQGRWIPRLDLMLKAEAARDPATMAQTRQVGEEVYALLAAALADYPRDAGLPGDLDPRMMARCFVAFIDGLKYQMIENPDLDVVRLIDTFWALIQPAFQRR